MGKIREHISTFRLKIRQHMDDTPFTDSALFSMLNDAKNKLRDQTLTKHNKVSDFEYLTFCIELERTKSHDCDCVKVGCDVLKSVYPLPETATSMTKDLIKVLTLGDKLIPDKNEQEIQDDMTDPVKGGKLGYMIRNKHLIVWNALDGKKAPLKAVQVAGFWENVLDWEGIQLCTEEKPCIDTLDLDFDVDGGKTEDMYRIAAQGLGLTFQLREDVTSDNNPHK